MQIIVILILLYAIKSAVDDTRVAYGKSKSAYMRRADEKFPHMPRSRRAAHAARHDIGYWGGQVLHGFPSARHGLAAGYHAGRKAQAEQREARERAKAEHLETRVRTGSRIAEFRERQAEALARLRPVRRVVPGNDADGTCLYCGAGDGEDCDPECPYGSRDWAEVRRIREERRRAGEGTGERSPAPAGGRDGRTFPVLLTGRSKSGRKVNPVTGAPSGRAAVYDPEDLQRRLDAAAADPDMEVTVEPLTADGSESDPHANCKTPGCGCSCHETEAPAPGAAGESQQAPAAQVTTKGTPSMAADITYDGVLASMTGSKAAAEAHSAEMDQASKLAAQQADQMQALEVDPVTLSAMADHLDAHGEAVKAQARVIETAEMVEEALKRGHAGLNAAHQDAPVPAAQRDFYAG